MKFRLENYNLSQDVKYVILLFEEVWVLVLNEIRLIYLRYSLNLTFTQSESLCDIHSMGHLVKIE